MRDILCNLCGGQQVLKLFDGADLLYHTTNRVFPIVRCPECGLVYLNPQPETEELATYYPDSYRPYKTVSNEKVFVRPEHPSRTILDIGCGAGDFLAELAQTHPDWAFYGVDFDSRAVSAARLKGFETFEGNLQGARFAENFFDEAHMSHLLEHVPNPFETLKETLRILKPGGALFITIPNFRSLSRFIFKDKWYHIDAPRHLFHFTPKTLEAMLKKTGFKEIKFKFSPSAKYFLESYSFWRYGKKKSFGKFTWRALKIPAWLIAQTGLASTMRLTAKK